MRGFKLWPRASFREDGPYREKLCSLLLLSGHDYERTPLWDKGPCIPCLAPIHKAARRPACSYRRARPTTGTASASIMANMNLAYCSMRSYFNIEKNICFLMIWQLLFLLTILKPVNNVKKSVHQTWRWASDELLMLAVSFPAEHVSKQRLLGVGGLFIGASEAQALSLGKVCVCCLH